MKKRTVVTATAGILMVVGVLLNLFVPTTPFPILDMTVVIVATVFFWGGMLFFAAEIVSEFRWMVRK